MYAVMRQYHCYLHLSALIHLHKSLFVWSHSSNIPGGDPNLFGLSVLWSNGRTVDPWSLLEQRSVNWEGQREGWWERGRLRLKNIGVKTCWVDQMGRGCFDRSQRHWYMIRMTVKDEGLCSSNGGFWALISSTAVTLNFTVSITVIWVGKKVFPRLQKHTSSFTAFGISPWD